MKHLLLSLALLATTLTWAQDTTILPDESTEPSLIEHVENWYANNMNYLSITLLMTVESSFIPFPSEIVIPPAA